MKPLPQNFYTDETVSVAQNLLGKKLILKKDNVLLSGVIVETEAYGFKEDPASHAHRGKKVSNQAMFGPVGHAYIYFIYGNHYCLNVVAYTPAEQAGAVLIRALEPVAGIEHMCQRRKVASNQYLTNGPGKLCQAFGITKELYGKSFLSDDCFITEGYTVDTENIIATARIGISSAQEKLWRFHIKDNKFVSK